MSLEIHFPPILIFSPPNMGDVSDKHDKQFHQAIELMEERYLDKFNSGIIGDYWFFLQKQTLVIPCRKNKLNVFPILF